MKETNNNSHSNSLILLAAMGLLQGCGATGPAGPAGAAGSEDTLTVIYSSVCSEGDVSQQNVAVLCSPVIAEVTCGILTTCSGNTASTSGTGTCGNAIDLLIPGACVGSTGNVGITTYCTASSSTGATVASTSYAVSVPCG